MSLPISSYAIERAVPWEYSKIRRVGPGGRTKRTAYRDVRSLVSEHLRLEEGDEPDLTIMEGVLSGGGRSKDSVRCIFIDCLLPSIENVVSFNRQLSILRVGQQHRSILCVTKNLKYVPRGHVPWSSRALWSTHGS